MEAGKSRHYHAALDHLASAQKLLHNEGRSEEWAKLVIDVRERHGRKSGFMPGFERIVEGHGTRREPSFLDRARKTWRRKARGRSKKRARR